MKKLIAFFAVLVFIASGCINTSDQQIEPKPIKVIEKWQQLKGIYGLYNESSMNGALWAMCINKNNKNKSIYVLATGSSYSASNEYYDMNGNYLGIYSITDVGVYEKYADAPINLSEYDCTVLDRAGKSL